MPITLACTNFSRLLSSRGNTPTNKPKKNNLLIDLRYFPEDAVINIFIGLFRKKGLPFVNQVARAQLPEQVGPTQALWLKHLDPNVFVIVKGFKNTHKEID
jgi:hypothetical protein